jgi:putative nucleotidyltransferase with HDIG domain
VIGEHPNLLVVIGEPATAQSVEAKLQKRGVPADSRFAVSTRSALAAVAAQQPDFVLADIDLPDGDGVDLMRTVAEHYPDVVRVLVADSRELGSLRSSGIAHRCLARPWEVDTIIEVVRRRYQLEASLADQALEQLLARTDRLPVAPSAYTRIAAEMRSREPAMDRIAGIIAEDPALTAKVLQHINSAFFSLRSEITTVDRAVAMLGMNQIMAIVMSVGLYGQTAGAPADLVESIKQDSMKVAALTRVVAKVEGAAPEDRDTAFLAGMLHDCGKLVMASNWPHLYADIAASDDLALETQVIGANHSLIGAYLLASWKLPDAVVEAVAHHHRPAAGSFDEFGPIGLVHVAHALANRPGDGTVPGLDLDFIGGLDMWDQTAAWLAAAEDFEYELANA